MAGHRLCVTSAWSEDGTCLVVQSSMKLIDDYYGDKGAFPSSLQALVTQGYLRAIPRDPVNGNKAEWKTVLAKEGGVSDVHSLSSERGANGTPYADW